MAKVEIKMFVDIDEKDIEKLQVIEHHAEYLLDLDSWPEIKSVYGVEINKQKD